MEGYSNSIKLKSVLKELYKNSSTQISISIALVLLCIIFTIASPYFLTLKNILNIGVYASIMGIMAAGCTVAMLLAAMDVSQYSIAALVGVSVAMLSRGGVPVVFAILVGIAIAIACGAFNGFVISKLKINPIIATLATGLIYRGLCYYLTNGRAMTVEGNLYTILGRGRLLGVPNSIWIMIVVFILTYAMLKYTAFGRMVFAVGGNPQASYLSGININAIRFGSFIVCGISAGISGVLLVSQVGAAVPSAGETALMDVITAVILGGISLFGGKGKISGTIIGVLILAVVNNGLVLLSVQSFYQMIVRGIIILIAVYIDVIRGGGFK